MSLRDVSLSGVAVLILLGMSCTEPPSYAICDFSEIEECHNAHKWDSLKIATSLVGKWKWEYGLNCIYATGYPGNSKTYAGTSIEFLGDGNFVLYTPDSTSHAHWSLDSIAYDGWQIVDPTKVSGPPYGFLYGRLRLCNDRLLANNSYIDGGDNFFVRE